MASGRHLREELGRFIVPSLKETGVSLGKGSYGEVVEMRKKGKKVAVKKIHPVFVDTHGWQTTLMKFEEECIRCVLK
jgi:hypothetical protein